MAHTVTMTAPAKINLALHVTGRRDDGYHLIESLVVFTRAGDEICAAPAESDELIVAGRYAAHVPISDANLIVRARDAMRARYGGVAAQPVRLRLTKNLPVASGVGGGSSDAAATMRILARLWDIAAEDAELADIGLMLGADVPMCLAARPLLARRIGDEIEMLPRFPQIPVVLVNPAAPLSTAHVFAALSRPNNPSMPVISAAGSTTEIVDWLAATRNDLEPAAATLAPEIGDVLAGLRARGALIARMSGSGATCFGIFGSLPEAEAAAAGLSGLRPEWFVAATVTEAAEASDDPA